jgi:hypothetical protein
MERFIMCCGVGGQPSPLRFEILGTGIEAEKLSRRLQCALAGLGWSAPVAVRDDPLRALDLGASRDPALLSDAAHNLGDVGGLALGWAGLAAGRLHAIDRHTHGWQRASILASFANATLLLILMGGLALEAFQRLTHPGVWMNGRFSSSRRPASWSTALPPGCFCPAPSTISTSAALCCTWRRTRWYRWAS